MEKIKHIINEKVVLTLLIGLVVLQPVFDLDYLIADWLDQFGLPRLSTIIRFIIIPLLVLFVFIHDKHKKSTVILGGFYGVALAIYFYFHCQNAIEVFPKLYFPSNFYFDTFQELTYVLTLTLPYALIYCFYKMDTNDYLVQMVVTASSLLTAVPIFIGDIVPFGLSTYVGKTKGNFLSWFYLIFDESHEIPKYYTSKFFFKEGNTIGILMFMVLPLLYYYFHHAKKKEHKIGYGILIFIHSLSMMILGTRVATYGAVLVPAAYLVLCVFFSLLKKESWSKSTLLFTAISTLIFGLILPYSPAVKNQQIDAKNDLALAENGMADQGRNELANNRITVIKESDPAYIHMFEVYGIKARYAQSISKEYYLDYYDYRLDPYFWVEMILNRPLEERVGGRNIQKIFFEYKWNDGRLDIKLDPNGNEEGDNVQTIYFNGCNFTSPCLTTMNRALGLGYSTFMNGSIVLEKDFVQQYYTFGPLGAFLLLSPWIGLTLVGVFLLFKYFKINFNLLNACYAMAVVFAFGSGFMSGHVLDQFLTSTMMALFVAILLKRMLGKVNEG